MRKLLFVLSLLLLMLGLSPLPAQAHMKAHCSESYVANLDPIVARGGVASHNHTFIGVKIGTLADPSRASWSSLQSAATTCAPSGDHASYWFPSLSLNGARIPASSSIAYYGCFQGPTADQCGTSKIEAYPHDLRMVAGNPNATAPQSTDIIGWVCRTSSGPIGPYSSPSVANCETRVPTNKGLAVHIDFPTCWDGVLADHSIDGNTADADGPGPQVDHVVYPTGYPSKTGTCPSTHPRKLSHLRLDVNFRTPGTTTWSGESDNVTLSSAWATGLASQYTMHGDFLNGWTDAGMADLLSCVNTTTSHPHGSTAKCGS